MKIIYYIIVVVLIGNVSFGKPSMVEIMNRTKKTNDMRAAADWLLRDGLATVHEKGPDSIDRYLIDTWKVGLRHRVPSINTEYFIVHFAIMAKGINYDIECLQQIYNKEYIYEYWLFRIDGPEWFGRSHAEFYITKAKCMYGVREVVYFSDQFFESYEVDGVELKLPINELEFLFKIKAWRYPDSYKNTDLANYEIESGKDGYYVLSDTWNGRVGHLFRNIFGPKRSKTTLHERGQGKGSE